MDTKKERYNEEGLLWRPERWTGRFLMFCLAWSECTNGRKFCQVWERVTHWAFYPSTLLFVMVCLAVLIISLSAVLSGCLYVHKIAHVVSRQSDREARKGLNVPKGFFLSFFFLCLCVHIRVRDARMSHIVELEPYKSS